MTLYQKTLQKFQERSGYKYKPHQEEGMLWCVEREQHKALFRIFMVDLLRMKWDVAKRL